MDQKLINYIKYLSTCKSSNDIIIPNMPEYESIEYYDRCKMIDDELEILDNYGLSNEFKYSYILGKLRLMYNIPEENIYLLQILLFNNVTYNMNSIMRHVLDQYSEIYKSGIHDFLEILEQAHMDDNTKPVSAKIIQFPIRDKK